MGNFFFPFKYNLYGELYIPQGNTGVRVGYGYLRNTTLKLNNSDVVNSNPIFAGAISTMVLIESTTQNIVINPSDILYSYIANNNSIKTAYGVSNVLINFSVCNS